MWNRARQARMGAVCANYSKNQALPICRITGKKRVERKVSPYYVFVPTKRSIVRTPFGTWLKLKRRRGKSR